jgi:hypothetical protein
MDWGFGRQFGRFGGVHKKRGVLRCAAKDPTIVVEQAFKKRWLSYIIAINFETIKTEIR